jgi:hypothetical protein
MPTVAPEEAGVPLPLSRRAFLQVISLGAAAFACPAGVFGGMQRRGALATPRYLGDHEFSTLEALCDRILPPDHDPGAKQLGAARYVERLLTAFDGGDTPFLYTGGPFSGRNPYPDPATGTASDVFPPNAFATPIPPSRLQELYWRAEILGGEAAGLPAQIEQQWGGALVGLRDVYRDGLAIVDDVAQAHGGARFVELDVASQDEVLALLDADGVFPADPVRGRGFLDVVIRHTLEGCFSAPEYGGNEAGAGWRMVGIEGDSQPLGHSIYRAPSDDLVERPDHPLSMPNPDEVAIDGSLTPIPLTPDGDAVQQTISDFTALLEQLLPGACG